MRELDFMEIEQVSGGSNTFRRSLQAYAIEKSIEFVGGAAWDHMMRPNRALDGPRQAIIPNRPTNTPSYGGNITSTTSMTIVAN